MGISWIYRLTKEELIKEIISRGIYTRTVPQLRQFLIDFARANPNIFEDKPADDPGYDEEADKKADQERYKDDIVSKPLSPHNTNGFSAHIKIKTEKEDEPTEETMDRIRMWDCHFDGTNLLSFLARIKELQEECNVSDDCIFRSFSLLVKDDAETWYRQTKRTFVSWLDLQCELKQFFLSPSKLQEIDVKATVKIEPQDHQEEQQQQKPIWNHQSKSKAILEALSRRPVVRLKRLQSVSRPIKREQLSPIGDAPAPVTCAQGSSHRVRTPSPPPPPIISQFLSLTSTAPTPITPSPSSTTTSASTPLSSSGARVDNRPRITIQIPDGPQAQIPLGARCYRVRDQDKCWKVRLDPRTGHVKSISEPKIKPPRPDINGSIV